MPVGADPEIAGEDEETELEPPAPSVPEVVGVVIPGFGDSEMVALGCSGVGVVAGWVDAETGGSAQPVVGNPLLSKQSGVVEATG